MRSVKRCANICVYTEWKGTENEGEKKLTYPIYTLTYITKERPSIERKLGRHRYKCNYILHYFIYNFT